MRLITTFCWAAIMPGRRKDPREERVHVRNGRTRHTLPHQYSAPRDLLERTCTLRRTTSLTGQEGQYFQVELTNGFGGLV
jgi:hypothetical protein